MNKIIEHLGFTIASIVLLLTLVALGTDKSDTPRSVTFAGISTERTTRTTVSDAGDDTLRTSARAAAAERISRHQAAAAQMTFQNASRRIDGTVPVTASNRNDEAPRLENSTTTDAVGTSGKATGPAAPIRK